MADRLAINGFSACLLCVFLTACNGTDEAIFQRYLTRLNNVLDQTISLEHQAIPSSNTTKNTYKFKQALRLPDKKRLTPTLLNQDNAASIGILDFLSIKQCAVQRTIAEKNNHLGKVASTSQQLLNTIRFIQQSPACLEWLKQNDKMRLHAKLNTSYQHKQAVLPYLLWQAVINEQEYRDFWSIPLTLGDYPQQQLPKMVAALQALYFHAQQYLAQVPITAEQSESSIKQERQAPRQTTIKQTPAQQTTARTQTINKDVSVQPLDFEEALGILRHGDGGRLLKSYQQLSTQLEHANQLIIAALNQPFCHPQHSRPEAKILQTVVNKVFIGEIQRHANALNQRYQTIMPLVLRLEELLSAYESPDYRHWRLTRDKIFSHARSAPKRHILLLNRLYQQCGLRAGNQTN